MRRAVLAQLRLTALLGAAVVLAAACGAEPTEDTARFVAVEVEEDAATQPILVPSDAAPPEAAQSEPLAPVPPPAPVVTRTEAPSDAAPDGEPAADPASCDVGSTDAAQVLLVEGSGSRATVTACARTDGGYVAELGPFRGYVGRNGVAPAGAKREGDGRTPSGTFALREGFGSRGDPGLAQGWSGVDASDVWVDDPASALYNTRQRDPADGRWASAEKLLNEPAYTYAQVIGYNESATPGAGSAIFLHVSTGGPTAGCVSLSTDQLLQVLRWERSGAVAVIR